MVWDSSEYSKTEELQLVLVEDNLCFARSVSIFFKLRPRYRLAAHFTSCEEALLSDVLNETQVLLLDIGFPEMNGIDAIPLFLKKFPHLQIIMLSSFNSEEKLFTALQNGASGYILKTDCFKFLENAIDQVQSGGMLFSPEMAKKVLNYFRPKTDTKFNLTKRENEVLLLLQQGMIKKEIAHRLNISYHTVDSHVKNIYKKLHVNSNVQAIRRASENLN